MTPNGCHSKPRPTPQTMLRVQDGYHWANSPGPDRTDRIVRIKHAMSCACVYGPMNNDPRCGAFPELGLAPCPHKEKK